MLDGRIVQPKSGTVSKEVKSAFILTVMLLLKSVVIESTPISTDYGQALGQSL